jgi:hypothetical protein
MPGERRFDTRFPLRLAVTVTSTKTSRDLFSEDVSLRGLFVTTSEPYPLRSLLRVNLVTPWDGRDLEVLAMAVHHVPFDADSGHTPGSGLALYGVDCAARARWDALVAFARAHPHAPPIVPEGAPEPEPLRRLGPRYGAEVAIHLERGEGPVLFTRDVAQGGLLLDAGVDLPVGASMLLHVANPDTGELVDVEAVVRVRVHEAAYQALGVAFVHLDEERLVALAAIASPWVPVFDEPDVASRRGGREG